MAYCLRSFVQIIEELLYPDQRYKRWVHDQDNISEVQSLLENGIFLRDFLDNSSPLIQNRIASLEDQIMGAAEKAEDTLETYLTSVLVSNPEEAFTIPPPNLSEVMQVFEDAREEVIKIMDTEPVQRPDGNVLLPVSTTRYPNHNNGVVGVTEDLNQLRSWLTSRAPELEIIPIAGMGGMGKTTLARILYDEYASSNSHFDCCAWATVSQTYDPKHILSTLLESVTVKPLDEQTTNELMVILYKALFNRKYLIVLDDIWSSKAWDDVRSAFPKNNNGSRIIFTTRENIVAEYVNPKCHEMHLKDEDESWELLRGKVFGKESCPHELEEVGRKIASSCGGLPLALQVTGGLLSQSHKSLEFWEHVANNVRSLIAETNDQFSGIFDSSFAHLPHYLKPCFLYMAGFQEDAWIPASRIIKLWATEGFLLPIRDKSLEEAARIHLNALVDRNLIFVREMGKSGRAKSFGIHDLLRDLCLRKAQEKKILYFKALQTENLQKEVPFLGRIVIFVEDMHLPILTPLTRSVRCNIGSCYNSVRLCFQLSLIRVLDLPKMMALFAEEFPQVILHLVNLRYLVIFSPLRIPISAECKLSNLRTLRTSRISSLAVILSVMPELQHLEFEDMSDYWSFYGVHENLLSLSEVPSSEVRKLLGKLPNLRKLKIDCRNDEMFIQLTYFHNLESLHCRYGFGYRTSFSHNMTLPDSLKKLTLDECGIGHSLLDAIGALPNLQILIIKYEYHDNTRIDWDWEPCEGGFCELKYLEIINWDLEKWSATEVHFPLLQHLVLKRCDYLIEIPNEFRDIDTLKIIEVDYCLPSLHNSARRIYEDQCEYGNTDLQLRLGIDFEELNKQWRDAEQKRKEEEVKRLAEVEEDKYSLLREMFE